MKRNRHIDIDDVNLLLNAILLTTGKSVEDMRNHRRKKQEAFSRFIFSHHCRCIYTEKAIAEFMGITHASIFNHYRKYANYFEYDKEFRMMAENVNNLMN